MEIVSDREKEHRVTVDRSGAPMWRMLKLVPRWGSKSIL